jgi:hypothetical protein
MKLKQCKFLQALSNPQVTPRSAKWDLETSTKVKDNCVMLNLAQDKVCYFACSAIEMILIKFSFCRACRLCKLDSRNPWCLDLAWAQCCPLSPRKIRMPRMLALKRLIKFSHIVLSWSFFSTPAPIMMHHLGVGWICVWCREWVTTSI